MSWLLKSLQINDPHPSTSDESNSDGDSPPPGVKEDLSFTIGRQLRGVAAFLAPPPINKATVHEEEKKLLYKTSSSSEQRKLIGIRNDLAEFGQGFKTGISKFASNLFGNDVNFDEDEEDEAGGDDDDDDYVPGITEEVIDFIHEVSRRPEYWTDFPLSLDNDFEMSDDQKEHALAAERLVPTLATLRANTHSFMEDGKFWLIYFILLLPRLDENDFELLSTAKIVETRNALLQKLQSKKNARSSVPDNTSQEGRDKILRDGIETLSSEDEIKAVTEAAEGLTIGVKEKTVHFPETDTDTGSIVNVAENDEDVSFSDLEDDDSDFSRRISATKEKCGSSPNGSNDWVQLNETQGGLHKARPSTSRDSEGESSDWLAVDEFD